MRWHLHTNVGSHIKHFATGQVCRVRWSCISKYSAIVAPGTAIAYRTSGGGLFVYSAWQHSTAQHSTAQHSTAQRSAAQRSNMQVADLLLETRPYRRTHMTWWACTHKLTLLLPAVLSFSGLQGCKDSPRGAFSPALACPLDCLFSCCCRRC